MATQTFRSFTTSLLLQHFNFGPDFSQLEIVSQTKNTVIIYVRSCERIKNLFTVEGLRIRMNLQEVIAIPDYYGRWEYQMCIYYEDALL